MQTNSYSAYVRIGNWLEETCLQSEKIELDQEQREKNQKLIQQTQEIDADLLRPMVLDPGDEFLRYGENTQLVCSEIQFPSSQVSSTEVVLSYSANKRHSSKQDGLLDLDFAVTASPFVEPCARNCFKICGVDSAGCKDGELLKFGDTFTINLSVSSKPLFVAADVPRLNVERGQSGQPKVKLVNNQDAYCRWTVTYCNKELRLEAKGRPVAKGVPVILEHKATNQNVTVETNFLHSTFLGKEFEVSARSFKDFRDSDVARNTWQFITGRPGSDGDDPTTEQ